MGHITLFRALQYAVTDFILLIYCSLALFMVVCDNTWLAACNTAKAAVC